MSARTSFLDALRQVVANDPDLAETVVVSGDRALGEVGRLTLIVRTESYAPLPFAPRRGVQWEGTVLLVSPLRDLEAAEDQLETALTSLAPNLLSSAFSWSTAALVGYDEQHLALAFTVTAI